MAHARRDDTDQAATTDRAWAVICVGDTGENGLAIARSLGRRGVPVAVVGVESLRCLPARSRYARRVERVRCVEAGPELRHILLRLAHGLSPRPVLFFDNEPMMLALEPYAEELAERFRITVPLGRADELTDKRRQMTAAEALGIPIPMSWYPASWAELSALVPRPGGRLIAKPLTAAARRWFPSKVVLAADGQQLVQALGSLADTPLGVLVQEYIEGEDAEVYVALCFVPSNGGAAQIVTGRKTRQAGRGAGGIMAVGQLHDVPRLRQYAARLADALAYHGPVGFEFKRAPNQGEEYLIELSPRTERFHALAWPAGLDLPWLAYSDNALGEAELVPCLDRTRTDYWIDFRSDFRVWRRFLQAKRGDFLLRPYLARKQWAVFALDDPLPWFYSTVAMLTEYAAKIRVFVARRISRCARSHRLSSLGRS